MHNLHAQIIRLGMKSLAGQIRTEHERLRHTQCLFCTSMLVTVTVQQISNRSNKSEQRIIPVIIKISMFYKSLQISIMTGVSAALLL